MQVNFPIQAPEKVRLIEITREKENFQPPVKNTSDEIKPEFKAGPEDSDKLQDLQNALGKHNLTLNFRHDDETNQLIVELVDSKTGDAIRQMPSEVSLKLSAAFAKLQGQLVDEHV